jgi:hypothetical protein
MLARGSRLTKERELCCGCSQDAQNGQTSHLPYHGGYFTLPPRVCQDRLFALGHALSHATPQQATIYCLY